MEYILLHKILYTLSDFTQKSARNQFDKQGFVEDESGSRLANVNASTDSPFPRYREYVYVSGVAAPKILHPVYLVSQAHPS